MRSVSNPLPTAQVFEGEAGLRRLIYDYLAGAGWTWDLNTSTWFHEGRGYSTSGEYATDYAIRQQIEREDLASFQSSGATT